MEIRGKYNSAKIFTENIEPECYSQIKEILNCQAFAGEKIRIQPDCHAGANCVVGYTQTYSDKIVPNLVGVDISCSMSYAQIPAVDLQALDKIIHEFIPAGANIHKAGTLPNRISKAVDNLLRKLKAPLNDEAVARILNSVGTLGGGNHFIEVDKSDETGAWYLVIHSGSRNLGLQVCRFWQGKAIGNLKDSKYGVADLIERLKKSGRESEIDAEVAKIKAANRDIPNELAYLEGAEMEGYLHDLAVADEFAEMNRRTMIEIIFGRLGISTHKLKIFTTKHNYVDQENKILRKGAISAYAGEEVLIPMNMRDGSLICVGKGNADWNYSAPHGAGRLMSRSAAKELISLEEFMASMDGIYSTSVNESTLDESPMVYKPAAEIEALISPTVEIREHLKPLYNFKAGGI